MNYDVDMIIAYVNNNDSVWRNIYRNYCLQNSLFDRIQQLDKERFDDIGLFRYMLLCVNKFMPWLRKIHLIVSNPEQVSPNLIEGIKNINIVYHKDIIPEKYLPTFNSTSIEMYLRRIPDLAEHIIYANDDMYCVKPLKKSDFFTDDGKIKMNYTTNSIKNTSNQFRHVCLNNCITVRKVLNLENNEKEYIKPEHTFTPLIKSHMDECIEKCGKYIFDKVEAFRTGKQHNQYIYVVWEYYNNNLVSTNINFKYTSFKKSLSDILNDLDNYDIICINDVSTENRVNIKSNVKQLINKFKAILSGD